MGWVFPSANFAFWFKTSFSSVTLQLLLFTFHQEKKNQKRYINTFVKGTHCTSKTVCRQESPRPWPDLSLSPEPSHLHELLQWLLRPGLLQAGLQGGGEAAAEGGGPGRGARRPQLGGLGQAGGVLPAQGLGRPSGAGNGRPAPALDQPSPRCWRTAPAALLALCRQASTQRRSVDTRPLPVTARGPALAPAGPSLPGGAPSPGLWASSTPPPVEPQGRTAVEACVMGG